MTCRLRLALVLCLAVSALAAESHADPIQVSFSGVIDTVNDPLGLVPSGIVPSAQFSGTYVVDSDPLGPPQLPVSGIAEYPFDPASSIDVTVGGNLLSLAAVPGARVTITNGADGAGPSDLWQIVGPTDDITCPGIDPNCVFLAVSSTDVTQTRLADTSYFVNTSHDGWPISNFGLVDINDPINPLVVGTITSLQIVSTPPVPSLAPIGIALLGILLGLAGWRRLRG